MYPDKLHKLVDTFLTCPARTKPELRRAIEAYSSRLAGGDRKDEGQITEEIVPYVEKVALHAYKIIDEDVKGMKEAGYSEDQIFEITLSATLGASLARLERGLALLKGDE